MNPDENWKETRVTAQDLSQLLGIPVKATEDILTVLENLIVHRFVEKISDDDIRGTDVSIELPYLGSLIVSVRDNGGVETSFVPRKVFYNKIKKACYSRNSPLVEQLSKVLGEELVSRMEKGEVEEDDGGDTRSKYRL